MNTVHVIMDTLKRSHLGCYGSERVKTPNLDRLAARSVVFERAYCSSFPCMPARRDFATGRVEFPFRGWGPLEEGDVHYVRTLSRSGIVTGLVTDHYHLFREGSGNYHWGYDCWRFERGMEADPVYSDPADGLGIDYRSDPERLSRKHRDYYYKFKHFEMKREEDWPAARTFSTAADWVRRNRSHPKGFHLTIDCFPPHEPFDPPPGYAEMYDPDYAGDRLTTPAYAPWREHYTERELRNIQALYAGTVTYVDAWFGRFMDELERLSLMGDTAVLVTTDHGTYTGEHGWTGKLGTYMYDCVAHVPMMLYLPGIPPRREGAIVQNVDVAPTMIDASGVGPSSLPPMHGSSLVPLARGDVGRVRDFAHSGFYGRTHVVNDGRYALHLWHRREAPLWWHGCQPSRFLEHGPLGPVGPDGRRRVTTKGDGRQWPTALFDLESDPGQERNVAAEAPEVVTRMTDEVRRFALEAGAAPDYLARLLG